MSDGVVQQIPWVTPDPEAMNLGRSIRHDPRNRAFPIPTAGAVPTSDVRHRNYGRKLYQDGIGACTCFAASHAVNFAPFRSARRPARTLNAADAFALYRIASARDPWPGSWEPDDTGSSGQAACQALIEKGYATGYEWAFGFDHGLSVIAEGPLMQGTWWTVDMFRPDASGLVHPTGSDAGGHEYLWVGVDVSARESWFLNSWQESAAKPWGRNGYFKMSWDDHRALLARGGDLVRPTL